MIIIIIIIMMMIIITVLCVGGRVPGDCSTLRVARVGNLPTGSTANTQAACEDRGSSKTTHLARKETPRGRAGTGNPRRASNGKPNATQTPGTVPTSPILQENRTRRF